MISESKPTNLHSVAGPTPPQPTPFVAPLNPTSNTQAVAAQCRWFEEGSSFRMPEVYSMVLEACSRCVSCTSLATSRIAPCSTISCRNDDIETSVLHPILLRSGLDRSVLGQLWTLCNKKTPGKLHKHELFQILALIAATQVSRTRVYLFNLTLTCHSCLFLSSEWGDVH